MAKPDDYERRERLIHAIDNFDTISANLNPDEQSQFVPAKTIVFLFTLPLWVQKLVQGERVHLCAALGARRC
jgi:hypothetical protein